MLRKLLLATSLTATALIGGLWLLDGCAAVTIELFPYQSEQSADDSQFAARLYARVNENWLWGSYRPTASPDEQRPMPFGNWYPASEHWGPFRWKWPLDYGVPDATTGAYRVQRTYGAGIRPWLPFSIALVASAYLLARNALRRRYRRRHGRCLFCGYSLHGLTQDRCPECGASTLPPSPDEETRRTSSILLQVSLFITLGLTLLATAVWISSYSIRGALHISEDDSDRPATTVVAVWPGRASITGSRWVSEGESAAHPPRYHRQWYSFGITLDGSTVNPDYDTERKWVARRDELRFPVWLPAAIFGSLFAIATIAGWRNRHSASRAIACKGKGSVP